MFFIVFKACGLLAVTGIFIRYISHPLMRNLAQMPELMMVFTLGLAAIMATFCHHLGLGKELGGLLAGIALAPTQQHNMIAARLSPLRHFLLLFFFIKLGAGIELGLIGGQIMPAIIFSVFVLIGKTLIVTLIIVALKYRKRTAFMAGISIAQISEFSLIFAAMAFDNNLLSQEVIGILTLTTLITIGVSTYAISYNNVLHNLLEQRFSFMRSSSKEYKDEDTTPDESYDVIVFGMGRYGTAIARQLQSHGARVLGVDFDPQAVTNAEESGVPCLYGDAADPDFAEHLPLGKVHTIVFAFHHYISGPLITDLRLTLADNLRSHGYKGHIAATTHHAHLNQDLLKRGIDIILSPFDDAALHGANHIYKVLEKRPR